MKKILKKILPPSLLLLFSKFKILLLSVYKKTRLYNYLIYRRWTSEGKQLPPPHEVKQMVVNSFRKKYGYTILVETGTFLGDMVDANKHLFKKIISIELSNELFEKAKLKFASYPHVILFQGDSGKILPNIIKKIEGNAIFWLDGHYSEGITIKGDKNTPILDEVNAILSDKKFNHVILIDDARCFNGENDYPKINELLEYIYSKDNRYKVEVKDDIIRVTIPFKKKLVIR